MAEGDIYPECFDPYLRYAIASNFKNFEVHEGEKKKSSKLFFLVEFKKAGQETEFVGEMNEAGFSSVLGPANDKIPYATLYTTKEAVVEATPGSGVFCIWETYVSRVELSLPIKPSAELTPRRALDSRGEDVSDPPGTLIIGMLDDGCPFAASHFLKGPASTRVRGIWDQNQGKQPIQATDSNGTLRDFGRVPTDFGYGLEFRRHALPPLPNLRPEIGLNEWIQMHSASTGSIDEDGCYAEAEFSRLASRQSHGGHVMDVLAGRVPTSSRVGPSPNWKPGTDLASEADVVFVQFPEDGIRDATGVWLKAYVLDGIRYILSFADPEKTERAIINISYGPTTGPHDGTATLEEALNALVAEFDGGANKPKLEIFLAAGNTYLSEGHVDFTRQAKQPDHIEWTWRLPPDNAVLCFAEIWMDKADADPVSVTLSSPSGATSTSGSGPTPPAAGGSLPPYIGVYAPVVWGNHKMWLLAVEPTGLVAEHGDWKIRVAGIPKNARVHAFVARSDPNMGVRTGARRSYFVDHGWELTRSAEASHIYADGEFDDTGSMISRYGTLNGIATAKHPRVHVAGGYIVADAKGRKSRYSSAGPARPTSPRVGPDYVLPCDESYALQGIRAGGNRSGSVFRLIGTSAAAPQLARHFADPPIPPAIKKPVPPDERYKRGDGNLEPP
jgi:hypothetical protein